MKIYVKLVAKKQIFQFSANIWVHNRVGDFHLPPIEFYDKFWGSIPEVPHHEVEILIPGESTLRQFGLHVHRSKKTDKPFICFPRRLPTLKSAMDLFTIWSTGAVGKMVANVELNDIYTRRCGENAERYFALMESTYKIRVVEKPSPPA